MPTLSQHREKALHNEFFVENLNNPFWDWAITGVFYAAVQYVEAYLATRMPPIHSPRHEVRDANIQKDTLLKSVYSDYRELKNESNDARYDASLTFSQTDLVRLQARLARIKAAISPHIGSV